MTQCLAHKWIRVTYSAPVGRCVRQLRVLPPPARGAQRVLGMQWRCEPEQDAVRELTDDFGNLILELQHTRIKREFIWAVELQTQSGSGAVLRNEGVPATGIGAFLLPSALCDANLEIERAVNHLRETQQIGPKTVEESAMRLCTWAHRAIEYSPGTTDARTTVSQALARGSGVCQDYAHVMIALCRSTRIPARYISGYLPGEGAMHAWVEVLDGDRWLAFDPTHNRRAHRDYVFVACGRDYRDVSPVSGSYHGEATARLRTKSETKVVATTGCND
jgi:transglutaminase-like putative cysteine protease